MDNEDIVQAQVDRYNAHDLDGFCALYADDIKVYAFGRQEPELSGKEAFRARYRERFALPALRARIETRIVQGGFVIDHERVSGLPGEAGERSVIAIYELEGRLIHRVTFIR
jgi:hypothetical protein